MREEKSIKKKKRERKRISKQRVLLYQKSKIVQYQCSTKMLTLRVRGWME